MHDDIFEELIRKYYQPIYYFCFVKLRDEFAARDCTQDVFLVMYKKRERFEVSDKTKIWLYKAADNIIKNYIKNNCDYVPIDSCENIPTSYSEIILEEEILSGVISNEERKLLSLYYLDGTDIKTLSKIENKSEAALYKRLQRIKAKIIKYWEVLK